VSCSNVANAVGAADVLRLCGLIEIYFVVRSYFGVSKAQGANRVQIRRHAGTVGRAAILVQNDGLALPR
jgi:hypothetical protein